MCLILIAHQIHEQMPLLVLANRDEFYDRPTTAAEPWEEDSDLIAGRDLVSGGTWLGVNGARWASVTNIREGTKDYHCTCSRGWLVRDYLLGKDSPNKFLSRIANQTEEYAGYNLLLGNGTELWYSTNRSVSKQRLTPGLYGLSNHLLDTPWPKVVRGKQAMFELLSRSQLDRNKAFAILTDTTLALDSELPNTGVPLEWERALSAAFITKNHYGTRCSSLLMREAGGKNLFVERSFTGAPDSWKQCEFTW
jgi:uncharacterized protein with NRDE domain